MGGILGGRAGRFLSKNSRIPRAAANARAWSSNAAHAGGGHGRGRQGGRSVRPQAHLAEQQSEVLDRGAPRHGLAARHVDLGDRSGRQHRPCGRERERERQRIAEGSGGRLSEGIVLARENECGRTGMGAALLRRAQHTSQKYIGQHDAVRAQTQTTQHSTVRVSSKHGMRKNNREIK